MTHRERHTPDEAPAREGTPSASPSASARASAPMPPSAVPASVWTEWYQRASPAQQQEALLRAIQQGVLYAHQLAAPSHAAAPVRSLLSSLLNGHVKELEPLHPPPLEYHDGELDRTQREAVARAVASPDVCLIQGVAGTGKSRLAAEIILQAAQRGERILFLAPTAAALDRVLERLSQHPALCPIRCLSAEERPADLPPAVARLTLPERLRSYRESTVPAARAARDAARQKLETRKREQVQWPPLEKLAEHHDQLAERLRTLTAQRDRVAEDVDRLEPGAAFGERWQVGQRQRRDALESLDGQLAGIQAEMETISRKRTHLDSDWEAIRPLAEARQKRRLWTGAWWRAMLQSGLNEQVRDLEARRAELEAAQQRLDQDLLARQSERLAIENRHAAELSQLRENEIARRVSEFDRDIAAATRDRDALREKCRHLLAALLGDAVPTEISRQSIAEGRSAWGRLREQEVQRAAVAEQWLQTVEEGVSTWSEKLARCANVLAVTTPTLAGNAPFDNTAVFDVLILDEGHQVTESEFAAAARRARRWVVLGRPLPESEAAAAPRKTVRSLVPPPRFFQRLWHNLHTDPQRLPFVWMRRDGRLLCRLRTFAVEQEKWIETESVVDRPDIELRILSGPRQAPQIVEVHFPSCMDLGEAKQFLFHELEELAVQTRGRSLSWTETAEVVILELATCSEGETVQIAFANGVQERVARLPVGFMAAHGGIDWHTCALEFSRAIGWTRQHAEEWIAERLGLRSPGRTVLLTAAYRLDPPSAEAPPAPNREQPRIPRTPRIKTKKL